MSVRDHLIANKYGDAFGLDVGDAGSIMKGIGGALKSFTGGGSSGPSQAQLQMQMQQEQMRRAAEQKQKTMTYVAIGAVGLLAVGGVVWAATRK
jgi:hypothetical protein